MKGNVFHCMLKINISKICAERIYLHSFIDYCVILLLSHYLFLLVWFIYILFSRSSLYMSSLVGPCIVVMFSPLSRVWGDYYDSCFVFNADLSIFLRSHLKCLYSLSVMMKYGESELICVKLFSLTFCGKSLHVHLTFSVFWYVSHLLN